MTYKIGDKVRIVKSFYAANNTFVGSIVKVAEVYDGFVGIYGEYDNGDESLLSFDHTMIELYTAAPTTYTRILEAMLTPEQVATAKRIAEAV